MDPAAARAALQADHAETVARLKRLDATFTDIVDSARDSNVDDEHDTEGITIAATRQQVAALVKAGRQRLADIAAATQRLDDGCYGMCLTCAEPIDPERLEVRPATPWCIDCARSQL